MTELNALADRAEAATGPDRELDAAIFAVVHPERVPSPIVESGYGWRYERGYWWLATGEDTRVMPKTVTPDRYTASVDAALSLVPEGMFARLYCEGPQAIIVRPFSGGWLEVARSALCPTLPNAIVAAALRAQGEA